MDRSMLSKSWLSARLRMFAPQQLKEQELVYFGS